MTTRTTCSRCKGDNDTDQAYCRPCKSAYNKAYREGLDPDRRREIDGRVRSPEQRRKRNLARYGITPEDWDRMHDEQLGRCRICLRTLAEVGRICVDHHHDTGRVRALLCSPCNTILGMAYEDTDVLERAVAYLKEHSA